MFSFAATRWGAQHQHVAGEPQRSHRQQHADTADAEEQQRLVVALPAAAVPEAPFPVEDVGRDDRDNAGDDLGGHGLGSRTSASA